MKIGPPGTELRHISAVEVEDEVVEPVRFFRGR